jgi:hypothetical protein
VFREKREISVEEQPRPATAKVANLILDTEAVDEDEANEFLIEEAARKLSFPSMHHTFGYSFIIHLRFFWLGNSFSGMFFYCSLTIICGHMKKFKQ